MSAAIEVADITVRYRDILALDSASVAVEAGKVTALIGMNGSGKSTLFKTALGLIRPDAGTVRVDGGSPAAARRRGIVGYVPQSEEVDWSFPLSVHDVVMMGRFGYQNFTRHPRPSDRAAVAEALDRVELTALADRRIGALSGGQRKRAFVARGLAQGADVLLLDEPFAGVDRRSEATITELLRELASNGGTVLVSSHDLDALPRLADDAILLLRRVLLHGSLEEALRPENLARAFGLDLTGRTEE